jgi:hypothetical protein
MSADSERSTATPSTDTVNLEANQWLEPSVLERLSATVNQGSTRGTSRTAESAAHVQRLAMRLGRSEAELAAKIPADTLRRLKFIALAHENPDGSTTYTHDVVDRKATGTSGGQTPLLAKDTSEAHAPRYDKPQRDSKGRFVK